MFRPSPRCSVSSRAFAISRGPSSALLRTALLFTSILALLATSPLRAQTVLIDLGDNFSTMTAQNWNTMVFNVASPDLIDDTGAMTGISFTPLFWGGDFQNSSNWIEDLDWVLKEAATDHFGGFSVSFITFGNLDGIYKLEVVCSHPQTNHLTDIMVNDQFSDGNFQNIPGVNGDDFDPEQDGRVAQNWLIWDAVTPVNGEIELRVQKLAGTNAISVGALRLTRVGDLPDPSAITVTTSADPTTVAEPGASVDFTVRVDNTGGGSVDITSLTDSVYGDLNGQGDCSMPQTIAESGFYTCSYAGNVSGNAGASQTNTVTVSGNGDSGAVIDDDSTTVDITDVLPTATATKTTSCQSSVEEPGGMITFVVEVANTSPESIDLTDLFDDTHGDLNGQGDCSVPQTIGAGSTYSCNYSIMYNGVDGDSETSTVTATFEDDEANTSTADGSAVVHIEAIGSTYLKDCFESGDLTGWDEVVPPIS